MVISKCYCINLYERNDRLQKAKEVFDKYNLPVEFYRVHKDNENGKRGCSISHINVIKKAYTENLNNVLIFEDDIMCNLSLEEFNSKMNEVYNFIENYEYDIFYLGSHPNFFEKTVKKISNNIYKTHAFGGYAYILSKSGINKYKDMVYFGAPPDCFYENSENAYAIYPSIFYPNESKSDIAPPWYNFISYHILSGYTTNSFKLKEYYVTHINIPLTWPTKVLIILSFIAFIITKNLIFMILPMLFLIYHLLKF
jgi:GR25 family glycosyltransferase involved in LPS biosynthesis